MPLLFVFDLDGTLVDSQRDIAESANAVLVEYGCPPQSEEAVAAMVGDGAAMLIARAFAAAGCPTPADALERFLRVYDARLLKFTQAYDGVPALLEALAFSSRLAVLTNKPLDAARTILDGLGLAVYFGDRVLGGDGPHPRKPDPSGLRQLMAQTSTSPEETLMIGDSIIDFRTARSAGTRVCLARYGFGFRQLPETELTEQDVAIDRPLDLLTFL